MRHRFFAFLFATVLLVSGNSVFSQNVNVAPAPATYATLGAAFTAINAGTHGAGAVTVSIVGNTVEPTFAQLNGAVFTSCSITPNGARTVSGNFNEAVVVLDGADNVTLDGLNAAGNSLTISNPNTGTLAGSIRASNGATNNAFKNLLCNGVGVGNTQGGRTINIGQSTPGTGGNNNNLIENCTVNGGRRGIQNFGTATAAGYTNDNTTIRGCKIKNTSALGIFIGSEVKDNLVEGCEVFNDAPTTTDANYRAIAIQGVGISTVRGCKVYNQNSTVTSTFIGIISIPILLTAPGSNASTVNIFNNMVSITDNNVGAGFIYGIAPLSNTSTVPYIANVYNNSILISGTDLAAVASFTVGMAVDNNLVGSATNVFNNISLNTRFGGDANTQHIGSLLTPYPGCPVNADYNIWTATDTARGFDGGWNNTIYNGIDAYRDSASNPVVNELHTVFSTTFSYVSVTDLHLVPASLGGSINGTSLAAITTDIDGNTRSATLPYRGADELAAGLFKTLTLNVGLEGAMPGGPSDIVTVGLAGNASPHNLIALATETVNGGTLQGRYYFGGAIANGTSYYLIAINRNHLETWSATPITFTAGNASYNFTTALSQAFGSNQVTYSGVATLFGGDVNGDGTIDASDGADVDNDAFNFVSGNQRLTDVTNDQTTDASDAAITDNNAFNFIGVVTPPSPNGISGKGLMSETNSRTTKVTRNLKQVGTSF
ncbi:MAG: hypothetical protein IPG02_07355 [Ignavibacteria bacterium]|jgi:hypothetical protein|nr:hypothetical protein [Ignavibacteria bacterium]MBK6878341.1 hypothetical protein [Ignavibacteria bacterium]